MAATNIITNPKLRGYYAAITEEEAFRVARTMAERYQEESTVFVRPVLWSTTPIYAVAPDGTVTRIVPTTES